LLQQENDPVVRKTEPVSRFTIQNKSDIFLLSKFIGKQSRL